LKSLGAGTILKNGSGFKVQGSKKDFNPAILNGEG
jgi:hypothetical protein